jgi:hypothetical protein
LATGWAIKTPPPRTLVRCARHRDVDATHRCGRCRAQLCQLCVKAGEERGVKFTLCGCGGRCEAIVDTATLEPREFGKELLDSFAYPLRGEARWQMALGAFVFGVMVWGFGGTLARALPNIMLSPPGIGGAVKSGLGFGTALGAGLVLLAVAGYVFAYMELVIAQTAKGKDEPPGFPDFVTVWESMLQPLGRMALLAIGSLGPGVALFMLLPVVAKLLGLLVLLAGLAYFPMGLLAVAIFEGDQGFDPRRVLTAIAIVPRPYALAASLFVATFGLLIGGSFFLADLPGVGGLVRGALITYFATASGRMLGLIYRHYASQLRWL